MKKFQYYLKFEPLSKIFYVCDSVIDQCVENKEVPLLELAPDMYQRLGVVQPSENASVVGFLLGRSGDCFSADWSYMVALAQIKTKAKTGVKIRFLDYEHCVEQLNECDALVLPGGAFDSSERYYTDPRNDDEFASERQKAYSLCIRAAVKKGMPILAICAGAQMLAGEFGLKLYRSFDYIETPIVHKTKAYEAHRLNVLPNTPLERLFGGENLFFINSRHSELLAPWRVQCELQNVPFAYDRPVCGLQLYAEANDGTPEAWGSESQHIMCVQWHPEDMAAKGDARMQRLFQWLADELG